MCNGGRARTHVRTQCSERGGDLRATADCVLLWTVEAAAQAPRLQAHKLAP